MKRMPGLIAALALLSLTACSPPDDAPQQAPNEATNQAPTPGANQADTPPDPAAPTAAEAAAFVEDAEARLEVLAQYAERQEWVQATYIIYDTELLTAKANQELKAAQVQLASEAARFTGVPGLEEDTARKLQMLRSGITIPAPLDPAKNAEQAEIGAKLKGMYGKGEWCRADGTCLALGELENILAQSRDPAELLDVWTGWHEISVPMRPPYARQVELANEGARELGFDNVGAMWRSGYDMDPDAFAAELERLWGQVSPLYEALHCHVRAELAEAYGESVVPLDGPIPAHLLGNMWAQDWANVYELVAPADGGAGYDLTAILREEGAEPVGMVRTGEAFFSSLGFESLPETFWERSMFVKPADRDVVCHASAWNIDEKDDLRIKMCIEVDGEDFKTIHHELGHNYYQRAYNHHSYLYRASANDGFHEAVGDTLSLSITPEYLATIGLLEQQPEAAGDVGLLLRQALEKVAFLPFGLLVDQWRWKVFAGEVGPDGYNELWWQLREKYQGVAAPNERPADAFDPGAKYHVPGNTPYTRYFLAHVLQFQFYRSLCEISGHEGPIHRCSFYGSEEAGRRLNAMLEMGRSEPWPEALEALTGSEDMDAQALLDYFAPLQAWLDEQNTGRQCGW